MVDSVYVGLGLALLILCYVRWRRHEEQKYDCAQRERLRRIALAGDALLSETVKPGARLRP